MEPGIIAAWVAIALGALAMIVAVGLRVKTWSLTISSVSAVLTDRDGVDGLIIHVDGKDFPINFSVNGIESVEFRRHVRAARRALDHPEAAKRRRAA